MPSKTPQNAKFFLVLRAKFPQQIRYCQNYKKCLQKHPKMPKIFSAPRAGVLIFLVEIQIFKTGSFLFWRDPNLKNGVSFRVGFSISPVLTDTVVPWKAQRIADPKLFFPAEGRFSGGLPCGRWCSHVSDSSSPSSVPPIRV